MKALKRFGKKAPGRIQQVFLIALGVGLAAVGLKGFLLPNNFIDGGVMGIAILAAISTNAYLSVLVAVFNLPFIIIGYRYIGKHFAQRSVAAILALALVLYVYHFPEITQDKLLAAVFGGICLGAGIGFCMRAECVLDGTEIAAILLSRRTRASIGDIILAFNLVIFGAGALILGLEIAMYSVLTYFAASRTIDFIIHGIEEYMGVIIVSAQPDQIRETIIRDLGRGVTILRGKRGMSGEEQEVLFCVFTRLEMPKIWRIVQRADPQAFVVTHRIDDTIGGMVKRRPFQH